MKISTSDAQRVKLPFPFRLFDRWGRPGRSEGRKARAEQDQRVAVLIDAENMSSSKIGSILSKADGMGRVVSAKIYGPAHTLGTEACLKAMEATVLKPVVCKGCIGGKNSVDIRMVVDAMDLLAADEVDVFVLASGDSDFFPFIERVHSAGKIVVGVSCSTANRKYAAACDEFVSVGKAPKPKKKRKKSSAAMLGREEVRTVLHEGVARNADADGWCAVSRLATWIQKNHRGFRPKDYGKSTYRSLLSSMDDFCVIRGRGGLGYCVKIISPPSAKEKSVAARPMSLAAHSSLCTALDVVCPQCTSLAFVRRPTMALAKYSPKAMSSPGISG